MPDLGKYDFAVLGSYAATILGLAALVLVSWLRSRSVRRRLERLESEVRRHG
jgi:heme exporter protein D